MEKVIGEKYVNADERETKKKERQKKKGRVVGEREKGLVKKKTKN